MSCMQMDPYLIYSARLIFPSSSCLPIQEAVMALFPVRSLLLRHDPQLHLHVVLPIKYSVVHGLL